MLIVCAGPDTFRALRRAQTLERAFKTKHDESEYSMERLPIGKDAADAVLERLNTASLFAKKRFLRTSELVSTCPKSKLPALLAALARDQDGMIVVTVEEQPLTIEQQKQFSHSGKFVQNAFSIESGKSFLVFAKQLAREFPIAWTPALDDLVLQTNGDSWLLWNELGKYAAGSYQTQSFAFPHHSGFDTVEFFLTQDSRRYSTPRLQESPDFLSLMVSQTRAALRIRDRATQGLHPYVLKKISSLKINDLDEKIRLSLFLHISQRLGYFTTEESSVLL